MDQERILVIDDSWVILERIKQTLTAAGYDVRTTTETVGAAKHLRTTDLVIVDFHMPGINGGVVLRSLRAAAGPDIPALFYLYTSDPDIAIAYDRYGFDGSLLRKGDEAVLLPQIRAIFRTIRMRKLTQKIRAAR
jgi:DNA-binding response OmpR family regulator